MTKKNLIKIFGAILALFFSLPVFAQRSADFNSVVKERIKKFDKHLKIEKICPVESDPVAKRVFAEYGAVYVSRPTVMFPPKCIFSDQNEVAAFQSKTSSAFYDFGGTSIELQSAAMKDMLEAISDAKKAGLNITPRGGSSAGKRSYQDTSRIWDSRFFPALVYWQKRGKISAADAEAAKKMTTQDQVVQVMEWEADKLWFNTTFSRTIFSSVAAPGTSQHLSMLAMDVSQYADTRVRAILNKHGWFQTIANDTPHFTYLGYKEDELPERGLRPVQSGGFKFWVPNL